MSIKEKELQINDMRELIGDPHQVDRELAEFRKQAQMFSSHRQRFIEKYPKQWIAVHAGEVKAKGRTLQSVMRQVDAKGLPREHTLVRYIDKNLRTFIL